MVNLKPESDPFLITVRFFWKSGSFRKKKIFMHICIFLPHIFFLCLRHNNFKISFMWTNVIDALDMLQIQYFQYLPFWNIQKNKKHFCSLTFSYGLWNMSVKIFSGNILLTCWFPWLLCKNLLQTRRFIFFFHFVFLQCCLWIYILYILWL